ncbi:MAG: amidoligase family protein [Oscillospiraceae bacterium]|nr:amidoligase family protein [Bacillota bacterium]
MRSQNFGIEIEMTGLTRQAAAQIIGNLWDIQVTHVGGAYDAYTIRDP